MAVSPVNLDTVQGFLRDLSVRLGRMERHTHADRMGGDFIQSGSYARNPAHSNVYEIYFPVPFGGNPTIVVSNGDTAAVGAAHVGLLYTGPDRFTVSIYDHAGAWVTGIFRINWIAHGPRTALPSPTRLDN